MSILPCMKCKHSLGSNAPNLFCEKFHVVVDHRGGCGVGEPIVITNADRIRAMTDDELAEFINMVWGNGRAALHPHNGWHDWLKEVVKDV